ncbi:bifunctional peptidase and (3S)-lysyl hydroxylase Jmjd7-like [Ptychodera flava]|uniref:bifunctional peptidase and (3S)-lysyl hydroxylase Jmjd7-like n=1 Tax=Ptychodera flava TaxID=63121 RepID=UPI00396A2F65
MPGSTSLLLGCLLAAFTWAGARADGERFGSAGRKVSVQTVESWPENSVDFLTEFVVGSKPLVFKGAARNSPAFSLWTDEYMLGFEESEYFEVTVENGKKENRTRAAVGMSLQQFIEQYRSGDLYLVNSVPDFLRKDVLLPPPLQCLELNGILLETIMWFSSGGTKSVVHYDAVDNINCVFSGSKEVVFIDPVKYADKIDIDHPEGNYCGVDVDSVNYTRYPGFQDVEYHHAFIEAGDCFFIPYKWVHQVRSYDRNIAVNIWWSHHATVKQDLTKCENTVSRDLADREKMLDQFQFNGLDSLSGEIDLIREVVTDLVKYRGITNKEGFYNVFGREHAEILSCQDGVRKIFSKLFDYVDENGDGVTDAAELSALPTEKWKNVQSVFNEFEEYLKEQDIQMMDDLTDDDMYVDDEAFESAPNVRELFLEDETFEGAPDVRDEL